MKYPFLEQGDLPYTLNMVENHVPNHILNRVIVKNQDWQTKNQIVLVRKEKPPLGPNGVIGQSARDIVENKVKWSESELVQRARRTLKGRSGLSRSHVRAQNMKPEIAPTIAPQLDGVHGSTAIAL